MNSEVRDIRAAAAAWLSAREAMELIAGQINDIVDPNRHGCWRPNHADLYDLSAAIPGWLSDLNPSEAQLERVSRLFDQIAEAHWATDQFGERYELCSILAFLGWRHAAGLGREIESQSWLRISDFLSTEPSAANDSLSSFLFPAQKERPTDEEALSLSRPLDIYLALSILRRERVRPSIVVDIATALYEELMSRAPDELPANERIFFLGELAFVAASSYRVLGKGKECLAWNNRARSYFADATANGPLLARVRLLQATEVLDEHGHEGLNRALSDLELLFLHFEMPREALVCKLASAINLKKVGDDAGAEALFSEIVREWRNSSEKACFAAAAGALADLRIGSKDASPAADLAVEALVAAKESGDKCTEACVWTYVSVVHRSEGNLTACISALKTARRMYEEASSRRMAAYARVVLAEVLIEDRRWAEALEELIAASPTVQAENMIAEGIHALKLLSLFPREFASENEALRISLTLSRRVRS